MNIIEELYYGNIDEISRKSKAMLNQNPKENELYELIKSFLNENQKDIFEQYIQLYGEKLDNFACEKYVNGFKTGLLIGIESSKLEF
ncbi:MAG: hypothetical protein IJ837_03510 [Clostridia bacterium]|nr:hypothetical protein [Clostridia bacterium]